MVPLISYQLELDRGRNIVSLQRTEGSVEPLRLTHEPGAGFWRRVWFGFLAILPIEGKL